MSWKDQAVKAARDIALRDLTEAQLQRLAIMGVVIVGAIFVAWSFGAFERFGLGGGFAPAAAAAEVEKLEKRVDANADLIDRNSKAIADLVDAQARQSADVDDLVLELLESRMRNIVQAICRSEDWRDRQRLNEDLDRLQRRYAERNRGSRYPEKSCTQL